MYLYFRRVLGKAREVVEEKADQQSTQKSMSTLIVELGQMTLASGHENQRRTKMQMMPLISIPPQLPMTFSCFWAYNGTPCSCSQND